MFVSIGEITNFERLMASQIYETILKYCCNKLLIKATFGTKKHENQLIFHKPLNICVGKCYQKKSESNSESKNAIHFI